MRRINEEREKGGLEPITLAQIIKEVWHLETRSLETILTRLDSEFNNVSLSGDRRDVCINGQRYSLHRLKYVVNKDGSKKNLFSSPRRVVRKGSCWSGLHPVKMARRADFHLRGLAKSTVLEVISSGPTLGTGAQDMPPLAP